LANEPQIWIFGKDDNLKLILGSGPSACPIVSAVTDEVLNGDYNLDFTIPSDHADSYAFGSGDTAVIQRPDGVYIAFQIGEIEDVKPNFVRNVYCKHAVIELADEIITRKAWYWSNSTTVMNGLLTGTRWSLGYSDVAASKANFTATNNTVLECIANFLLTYKMEIGYRVTISGGAITARLIDLYTARGTNKGRRFEWTKDLTGIERTVNTEAIKTALIGIGADTGVPIKATTQTEQLKTKAPNFLSFSQAVWKVSAASNIFHYDIADPTKEISRFSPVCSTNTASLVLDKGVYAGVSGSSNSSIKLTKSDPMAENLSVNTKDSPTNVDASTLMRFSVYVNASKSNAGQLNIICYDTDGLIITTLTKAVTFSTGGFVRYDYSFTTPNNCAAVAIEVKALAVTNKFILWCDAFMMDIGAALQAWVQGWQYSPRPFDKPIDVNYLEDNAAKALYGRANGTRHKWGFYVNNNQDDPDLLIKETYDALQQLKKPQVSYILKVVDLSKTLAETFMNVQLGDPVTVIDDGMAIELQSRIIEIKQDLLRSEKTEIVLETLRAIRTITIGGADYHSTTVPTINSMVNIVNKIDGNPFNFMETQEAGGINTEWLVGEINALRNVITAGGGTVTMTDGKGILIESDPVNHTGSAMKLISGGFGIAPTGSWNGTDYAWTTFGTGDGFTADKINAGTLNATQVRIQMNTGTFYIDGNGIHHTNFQLLSNGSATFSGTITGGSIVGANITSANDMYVGGPTDIAMKRIYFSSGALIQCYGSLPIMELSTWRLDIVDQQAINIGSAGTTTTFGGTVDFSGVTINGLNNTAVFG
jgi:phage minor structural protein